jgi:hypothetical protein
MKVFVATVTHHDTKEVACVLARSSMRALLYKDLSEFARAEWKNWWGPMPQGDHEFGMPQIVHDFFEHKQYHYRIFEKDLDEGLEGDKAAGDCIIHAFAWTDDHAVEVNFDALEWFKQASDDDILGLSRCNAYEEYWGYDYPSDEVAIWTADINGALSDLFWYQQVSKKGGFECRVDVLDAMKWLKEHRPELATSIEEEEDND